ncbi:hypothetical protein ACQP3C_30670, partial [Escherichia coli]
ININYQQKIKKQHKEFDFISIYSGFPRDAITPQTTRSNLEIMTPTFPRDGVVGSGHLVGYGCLSLFMGDIEI